jgi:hypothetical protein
MQRSGEQTFALDQQVKADIRQMSATDLRRERDRLRDLLSSAPPSVAHRIALLTEHQRQAESQLRNAEPRPARGRRRLFHSTFGRDRPAGRPLDDQINQAVDRTAAHLIQLRRQEQQRAAFLERHAPDASRYLAIIQELGWRHRAHPRALETQQPAYLVNALGPVPETSRGRRTWRAAAIQIDTYRRGYGIGDPDDALGLEPQRDLERRKAWCTCREAIDHHWQDERQGRALPGADDEG